MSNLSLFTFSKPIKNRSGGQNVYINENYKKVNITINGTAPFGIQTYNNSSYIDIQLTDPKYIEYFTSLDNLIIQEASKNSLLWFNKSIHETVITDLYKSSVKTNPKYPPLLRIKLQKKNNMYDCNCISEDNNQIDVSKLQKHSKVSLEIENTGVYFISNSFGTSWKALTIKINENNNNKQISGYSFVNDD